MQASEKNCSGKGHEVIYCAYHVMGRETGVFLEGSSVLFKNLKRGPDIIFSLSLFSRIVNIFLLPYNT